MIHGFEVQCAQAREQTLVVKGRGGEPTDSRDFIRLVRIDFVFEKVPVPPVLVVGVVIVHAGTDVLTTDQFHVEASLSLAPENLDSAGQNDDQAVPSVDRLGHDATEIRRLPALDVADHQTFGLIRLRPGWVGESMHNLGRCDVQLSDCRFVPVLVGQNSLVSAPIEVMLTTTL